MKNQYTINATVKYNKENDETVKSCITSFIGLKDFGSITLQSFKVSDDVVKFKALYNDQFYEDNDIYEVIKYFDDNFDIINLNIE